MEKLWFIWSILYEIKLQACHQWRRAWGKWDAPWRRSQKRARQSWGWAPPWWRRPVRRRCRAPPPWPWWMREWARRGPGFHSGSATTFWAGSFLVFLVWSGPSILPTSPILKRMRNRACLFEDLGKILIIIVIYISYFVCAKLCWSCACKQFFLMLF